MEQQDKKQKISKNIAFTTGYICLFITITLAGIFIHEPNMNPFEMFRQIPAYLFLFLFVIIIFISTIIIRNTKETLTTLLKHTFWKYFFLFLSSVLTVYVTYFFLIQFEPHGLYDWVIWLCLIFISFIAFLFLKHMEEQVDIIEVSLHKFKKLLKILFFTTILMMIFLIPSYVIYSFIFKERVIIFILSFIFTSGAIGTIFDAIEKGIFETIHFIFILLMEAGSIIGLNYFLHFGINYVIFSSVIIDIFLSIVFITLRKLKEDNKLKKKIIEYKELSQV